MNLLAVQKEPSRVPREVEQIKSKTSRDPEPWTLESNRRKMQNQYRIVETSSCNQQNYICFVFMLPRSRSLKRLVELSLYRLIFSNSDFILNL